MYNNHVLPKQSIQALVKRLPPFLALPLAVGLQQANQGWRCAVKTARTDKRPHLQPCMQQKNKVYLGVPSKLHIRIKGHTCSHVCSKRTRFILLTCWPGMQNSAAAVSSRGYRRQDCHWLSSPLRSNHACVILIIIIITYCNKTVNTYRVQQQHKRLYLYFQNVSTSNIEEFHVNQLPEQHTLL